MINLLKETRKYVQAAHNHAEAKHDTYGEDYMSTTLWDIMSETEELLNKIDKILKLEENEI